MRESMSNHDASTAVRPRQAAAALHFRLGEILCSFYDGSSIPIPVVPHLRHRLRDDSQAIPHKAVISGYQRENAELFIVLMYRKVRSKWRPFAGYPRQWSYTKVEKEARARLVHAASQYGSQAHDEEVQHVLCR